MTLALIDAACADVQAAKEAAAEKFWKTPPAERRPYTLDPPYQQARTALWRLAPTTFDELEKKWRTLAGGDFVGYPEWMIQDLKAMAAAG